MAKKKEKYIPLVGITGAGEDYNIYNMTQTEKIIGFIIGLVAGFAAMQIVFGEIVVSIILGVLVGFAAIPVYKNHLFDKRKRAMRLQFRDMLDSLSNSFSAGKNTPDAFADALYDMSMSYNEKDPIVAELGIIIAGLHNNFVIEDLLRDMGKRCGLDDITSFAETFAVCNRLGGNLKKIVSESRDIITDKIEIEMEIETTISASKNELNIMCVMPFIIILMMGTMSDESITGNSGINVIVKLVAMGIFVVAYIIGKKITDIKV